MANSGDENGSSLVEVLIAAGILIVALVSLAQLLAIAIRDNINARATTYATILASQKLEELRGVSLNESPAGVLANTTEGFVDYVDAAGRVLGTGAHPPTNATFLRRWAVTRLPADPDHAMVVQVLVTPMTAPADRSREGRLVTVRAATP
jgi:type II secretory pathway pseudopilin PulG